MVATLTAQEFAVLNGLSSTLGVEHRFASGSYDAASDVNGWLGYVLGDSNRSAANAALREQVRLALGMNVLPDAATMFAYYYQQMQLTAARKEIGTRSGLPNGQTGFTAPVSFRVSGYFRSSATTFETEFANFAMNSGVYTHSGGTLNIKGLALEYPIGSALRPITFNGGAPTGITAGDWLIPDAMPYAGVRGDRYRVWGVITASALLCHGSSSPYKSIAALGDATQETDYTVTGQGFVDDDFAFYLGPTRTMGLTADRNSVLLAVDSRGYGAGETVGTQDISGDCGDVARAIGATTPYFRSCGPGMQAAQWAAASAILMQSISRALPDYVYCNLGINDMRLAGASAAQVIGYLQAVRASFPGIPFYVATYSPDTNSTDGWATLVNQSALLPGIVPVANALIRSNAGGFTGYKDVASFTEQGSTGLWKVTGSPGILAYASDAVHATALGNKLPVFSIP